MSKLDLLNISTINSSDFEAVADFWVPSNAEKEQKNKMQQLFSATSFKDSKMAGVAKEMCDKFFNGTGGIFCNDYLSNVAAKHESFKNYTHAVNEIMKQLIVEKNGNIYSAKYDPGIAMNEYIRGEMYFVKKMQGKGKDVAVQQPSFAKTDDYFNGLGICVHGLYGSRIEVTSFRFDGEKYTYTLHFTYYDIFGLDRADIEEQNIKGIKFGHIRGFNEWYILQHYAAYNGKYKPFITYMAYDQSFESYK